MSATAEGGGAAARARARRRAESARDRAIDDISVHSAAAAPERPPPRSVLIGTSIARHGSLSTVNISSSTEWKSSCRVATTADITLSGLQTIDGIVIREDDRILVKNQSRGQDNGIYTAAPGAWSRAEDCNTDAEILHFACFVREGNTQADQQFVCTNDTVTLGTTQLVIALYGSGGALNLGDLANVTLSSPIALTDGTQKYIKYDGTQEPPQWIDTDFPFTDAEITLYEALAAHLTVTSDAITLKKALTVDGTTLLKSAATIGTTTLQTANSTVLTVLGAATVGGTLAIGQKISGSSTAEFNHEVKVGARLATSADHAIANAVGLLYVSGSKLYAVAGTGLGGVKALSDIGDIATPVTKAITFNEAVTMAKKLTVSGGGLDITGTAAFNDDVTIGTGGRSPDLETLIVNGTLTCGHTNYTTTLSDALIVTGRVKCNALDALTGSISTTGALSCGSLAVAAAGAVSGISLGDLDDVGDTGATPAQGSFLVKTGSAWGKATNILSSIGDVSITNTSSGHFLVRNNNNNGWVNRAVTIPSSLGDLSDVNFGLSVPVSGNIFGYTSAGWRHVPVTTALGSGNLSDLGDVTLGSGARATIEVLSRGSSGDWGRTSLILTACSDVSGTPADGQVLTYVNSTTKWQPRALPAVTIPSVIEANLTIGTTGTGRTLTIYNTLVVGQTSTVSATVATIRGGISCNFLNAATGTIQTRGLVSCGSLNVSGAVSGISIGDLSNVTESSGAAPSQGQLLIRGSGNSNWAYHTNRLSSIGDVSYSPSSLSSSHDGHVLTWDGSKWINKTVPGAVLPDTITGAKTFTAKATFNVGLGINRQRVTDIARLEFTNLNVTPNPTGDLNPYIAADAGHMVFQVPWNDDYSFLGKSSSSSSSRAAKTLMHLHASGVLSTLYGISVGNASAVGGESTSQNGRIYLNSSGHVVIHSDGKNFEFDGTAGSVGAPPAGGGSSSSSGGGLSPPWAGGGVRTSGRGQFVLPCAYIDLETNSVPSVSGLSDAFGTQNGAMGLTYDTQRKTRIHWKIGNRWYWASADGLVGASRSGIDMFSMDYRMVRVRESNLISGTATSPSTIQSNALGTLVLYDQSNDPDDANIIFRYRTGSRFGLRNIYANTVTGEPNVSGVSNAQGARVLPSVLPGVSGSTPTTSQLDGFLGFDDGCVGYGTQSQRFYAKLNQGWFYWDATS